MERTNNRKDETANQQDIAVMCVKLDHITGILNQIVTQTAHIEVRVDKLEQGRAAVRIIAAILAVMLPFVIGIGSYTLNLHIQSVVDDRVEQTLKEGGFK